MQLKKSEKYLVNVFLGRKFELQFGGEIPIIAVKNNIATSKGNIDAFLLATKCVKNAEEIRINIFL